MDLKAALAKVKVEDLNYACCCCGGYAAFVFFDLVAASDSEVDTAFANECGDVGGREEDKREREVLDQGDVKARVTVELDIGAVEKVETDLVETALCCGC